MEERDKLVQELEENRKADELAQKDQDDSAVSSHRHHHHHHHHHSSEQRRKRRKRRRITKRIKRVLIALGVVLLLAVMGVGIAVFTMYHTGKNEMKSTHYSITAPQNVVVINDGKTIVYNGEKYRYKSDILTFLFIGVDKTAAAQQNDKIGSSGQSDVLLLSAIDKASGKIYMINIPRDIITDVGVYSPGGGYVGREKLPIATAYAYGDGEKTSCVNAAEAVSRLFYNVPVSTYFSLNLDGIAEINDSVGGVDVTSPETVGDFVEGESYHLQGEMARKFIQSRATDRPDANLLRNNRQKLYMNAFLKKAVSAIKSDPSTALDFYNVALPFACSNITADRITYLATEFIVNRNMTFENVSVPVEVTVNEGRAENYVKEDEFYELFLSIFYTKVSE